MTHTDYTRNILNIKDKNIYFYENCLETRKENGKEVKIFHGYLTYTQKFCDACGVVNEGTNDIIKWGFDKNCLVKIPKVSNFNTILLLDKQRFYCKHCHCTFNARTSLVDFHKQISNNTKLSIILDLMNKGSEKDISIRNNVSTNSTNRILDEISEDKIVKNNGILPEILGIDEFKATTDTISKMAFIIVDQDKKNIFDINNSRKSLDVEKYFKHYSKKQRDNVKFITLDLYKPYYKLMHSLFRNAILIHDRFHIVIQARNAFDYEYSNVIVEGTNNFKQIKYTAYEYRKFKHLKAELC